MVETEAQVEERELATPPGAGEEASIPQTGAKGDGWAAYRAQQRHLQRAVEARKASEQRESLLGEEVAKLRLQVADLHDAVKTDEDAVPGQRANTVRQEVSQTRQALAAQDTRGKLSDYLWGQLQDMMEASGVQAIPGWEDKVLPLWSQDPHQGYEAAKRALKVEAKRLRGEMAKPTPPSEELIVQETAGRSPGPRRWTRRDLANWNPQGKTPTEMQKELASMLTG